MHGMTAAQRVEAGVAWLDEHVPDWVDRVEVKDLELTSACDCVLGQIFAEHDTGMGAGFVAAVECGMRDQFADDGRYTMEPVLTGAQAIALGFDSFEDGGITYEALQAEWEDIIESRK